jgi:hypothetical protein
LAEVILAAVLQVGTEEGGGVAGVVIENSRMPSGELLNFWVSIQNNKRVQQRPLPSLPPEIEIFRMPLLPFYSFIIKYCKI